MENVVIREFSGDGRQWDQFIQQHTEAKIYHLYRWKSVVQEAFGHQSLYLAAYRGEELVGVLPLIFFNSSLFGKFLVSVPFFNYGGELVADSEVRQAFYQHLQPFVQEKGYQFVEFRHDRPIDTDLPVKQHKVTFILPLPENTETLWKSLKAKVRSQVRRPLKEYMSAQVGGIELLDDYYHVFARNMRDLGTPVYARKFFATILNHFPKEARLVVVYSREQIPVAAAFLLGFRDTMEIPWASSLREYNRFSPNMLLYWKCFETAIGNGFRYFDFGRCTPGSGTYRFKKQWGGTEKPLYWYYILPEGEELPQINPENPKYELAIKIWQKLPVWFTKLIGPKIIKNIP